MSDFPTLMNEALVYREFGCPRQVLAIEREPLGTLDYDLRVEMHLAPVNPSDLIPVRGAYAHRVQPPRVAGYEGVGRVVEVKDKSKSHLVGRRVLPLRASGTWQKYVDCTAEWSVQVPEGLPDHLAARAYINPLTALLMTKRWPPAGKSVVLTAASSNCAAVLARICLEQGAASVTGIYRTRDHEARLSELGLELVHESEADQAQRLGACADLIFDAVGGPAAKNLEQAARCATFVSYGNLSGATAIGLGRHGNFHQFRLVEALPGFSSMTWQKSFEEIWPVLARTKLPPPETYPLAQWREAIFHFDQRGRATKPVLSFR